MRFHEIHEILWSAIENKSRRRVLSPSCDRLKKLRVQNPGQTFCEFFNMKKKLFKKKIDVLSCQLAVGAVGKALDCGPEGWEFDARWGHFLIFVVETNESNFL